MRIALICFLLLSCSRAEFRSKGCFVSNETNEYAEVTCGKTIVLVQKDQSAINPSSWAEVVDPCGDIPNFPDEILIRLKDGSLIWSYSDDPSGTNTRLTVLGPGEYHTYDGGNICYFSVSNSNELYNEHN